MSQYRTDHQSIHHFCHSGIRRIVVFNDRQPIVNIIHERNETHLNTGEPVTLVSLNAVYQTGSNLYRSLMTSRMILLYGSSSK